jgi:hypothetical protein
MASFIQYHSLPIFISYSHTTQYALSPIPLYEFNEFNKKKLFVLNLFWAQCDALLNLGLLTLLTISEESSWAPESWLLFANADPDPGEPNRCGSLQIQVRKLLMTWLTILPAPYSHLYFDISLAKILVQIYSYSVKKKTIIESWLFYSNIVAVQLISII